MRRPPAQLALFVLTLILGFLVVVQLQAQSVAGLEGLSAGDLTTLIANLNTRDQQLATEQADLSRSLSDLRASGTQHSQLVTSIRDDLSRVRRWAGLDPVVGRGVRLTVGGPVRADLLNQLVNELRAAGAEAIAIEDVRVSADDVAADLPDGPAIGNRSLASPVTVWAVGNPQVVTAALTRVGGIIGRLQVSQPDVTIAVIPEDEVHIPAAPPPGAPAASATLAPHA